MPPAVVVAGLVLAAILLVSARLLLRRRVLRPRNRTGCEAFRDAAAGYHKEAPGWPVDDWPVEGQEEEETCPECHAVLIYAMPMDEQDGETPEAAGGVQEGSAPHSSERPQGDRK
jgi:hypothetical protein